MRHFSLLVLGFVFIISCTEQKNFNIEDNSSDVVSLAFSEDSDYKPHTINEALNGDFANYLKFFEGTDYEIGISTSKDGALPGGSTISCISGVSQIRKASLTKAAANELPSIRSFVDGIEISTQNISRTKALNSIMDSFGKVVKFSFCNECQTKSSNSSTGEAEMYVPKAIEFIFPRAESEEDLNPLCYYKDFVIKWNKDEDNQNGVLIVVDWTGSMILGNDIPDTHVCRVVKFPDTGEAQLPETIFDGIPDTAHCDMLILRGNIENIEQGQYTYKLVGKTHQQISFILIREIEK